jgi:hypothetical protein
MSLIVGSNLPSCPTSWTFVDYPSVTFTYAIIAVSGLAFALVAGIKYNSVKVFNRSIRTENISNTLWILFYMFIALRGTVNTLRYALADGSEDTLDNYLIYSGLVIHGLTGFCLTLALNHQHKFRSTAPNNQTPVGAKAGPNDPDPLLSKYGWLKKSVGWSELLYFALFLLYLAFVFVMIVRRDDGDEWIWVSVFLAVFGLQRMPVLILAFLIALGKPLTPDGPTAWAKAYLVVGVIFSITNDLPIHIWAEVLPNECTFWVASWVDVIHIFYLPTLVCFFLFIRSEYLRNMEECIWTTVSQIQDTFDFRRF